MINLISNNPSSENPDQIQKIGDGSKVEQTYNRLFETVTKLNEKNLICRSNCNFCNHPARFEAEKKWEERHRAYPPVEKFFKQWEIENPDHVLVSGDKKMSGQSIRNHLLKHYAKQEQRMWMKEYAADLKKYMQYRIDLDEKFEVLSAVFEKQLFDIGSSENLDPIKQSDQMVKLGKMLLEVEESKGKLRGDIKPVNVMQEKLMNVWFHVISNQQDQKVKTQLLGALDTFQEHVGGLTLE